MDVLQALSVDMGLCFQHIDFGSNKERLLCKSVARGLSGACGPVQAAEPSP